MAIQIASRLRFSHRVLGEPYAYVLGGPRNRSQMCVEMIIEHDGEADVEALLRAQGFYGSEREDYLTGGETSVDLTEDCYRAASDNGGRINVWLIRPYGYHRVGKAQELSRLLESKIDFPHRVLDEPEIQFARHERCRGSVIIEMGIAPEIELAAAVSRLQAQGLVERQAEGILG